MRMIWRPFAALLLCLASTPVQAQDNAAVRGFHLPGGGAAPLPSTGSFDSIDEANEVVRRITVSVGIVSPNFTVLASDQLDNAAAWIGGNKRYIGYKPTFMKSILTRAGKNYFSLIGIVAHEVGHHFLGHTTDDLTAAAASQSQPQAGGRGLIGLPAGVKEADWLAQRRRDELDADYFSGFVLAKLGATKAEASGWLAAVPDPGEGASHPRNAERKVKIEEGWTEATGKVSNARAAPTAKFWDHNGSKMKLVTSDARVLFFYEEPRKAIADRGVDKGALLFDGQIEGMTVEGLIYAFSFKCGKFGYRAKGTASGKLIELTGLHPTINDKCEIVRQQEEKLIFVAAD